MSKGSFICGIISSILYLIYTIYTWYKYKPSCLSESYYLLPDGRIFSIWMLLVTFLLLPPLLELSPDGLLSLAILSALSTATIGISPKYLADDRNIHILGTTCAVIISIIWGMITKVYLLLLLLIAISILIELLDRRTKLFWIENIAFINIYLLIYLS